MVLILDAGHGIETPGKCSPDKRLKEYAYTREIVKRVHDSLKEKGYEPYILVQDEHNMSLKDRVSTINCFKDAILVSIHCNAAGNGLNWMNANGWSVFVAPNASSNSKKLATCLAEQVKDIKLRKQCPDKLYWTSNLYICKHTKCPAVLTENMFMDNKEDVNFLLSDEGKLKIVDIHVNGIIQYLND